MVRSRGEGPILQGDKLSKEIKFTKFVTNIAEQRGWKLNPDEEAKSDIVKGLIRQHEKHGKPYCPCEFIAEEDPSRVCPCDKSDEDISEKGFCNCQLFFAA